MEIEKLVSESKEGSIESFMELIKYKYDTFYRIAYSYTKNQYDTEDCISEAVIKAFDKIKQLEAANSFYSWYISILINICRKNYNRKEKSSDIEELNDIESNFNISDVEDRIMVKALLESLKKTERDIVILKYLKNLTIKEIAGIIKIPENTVKTKLYRAIHTLNSKIRKI